MKLVQLCIVAGLVVTSSRAQTIQEALTAPVPVKSIVLNGSPGESRQLVKNAAKLGAVESVLITGISDSIALEQELIAVAACPSVHQLTIENCSGGNLSGAIRMLIGVKELVIRNCTGMQPSVTFALVAGMSSLNEFTFGVKKLESIPRSFGQLRLLKKIRIENADLSLADGYALNTHAPGELLAERSSVLGFGENSMQLMYSCFDAGFANEHLSLMRDLVQGVYFAGNEIRLPHRPEIVKHNHPLVKPPVAGLDVASSSYTTNAASGGMIDYPSGTKIFIPANAFVDKNGKPVSGNVTIAYREFRDPVDILVSGIPMTYDSAGQTGDFESAGMFEMNASVNGEEVFLAPGKKVDLDFAVVDTASTYNFYRLDEQKGWEFQQTTGAVEKKSAPVNSVASQFSAAIVRFRGLFIDKRDPEPRLGDTTLFDAIYQDTNYCSLNKRGQSLFYPRFKNRKQEIRWLTRWRWKKVSTKSEYQCFTIDRISPLENYSRSPEMNSFRGVTWMLNEPVNKAVFNRLRSTRSGIMDVRIIHEGGQDFTMELKFPWGFQTYSVTPVRVRDREPKAYSEKFCNRMARSYNRRLNKQRIVFDRRVNKRISRHNAWQIRLSADSLRYWQSVQPLMTGDEQQMNFREWVDHVKANVVSFPAGSQGADNSMYSSVYQSLSIMKFGIYNCDQVRRIVFPVKVLAVAIGVAIGKILAANRFFVIDKNRNQAFSYYGAPGQPIDMAYGAKSRNVLIAISEDGTMAVADEEAFKANKRAGPGMVSFDAKELGDQPATPQMLRDIIYPEKKKK